MLTSGPMALAMDDITTWRPEKKHEKKTKFLALLEVYSTRAFYILRLYKISY